MTTTNNTTAKQLGQLTHGQGSAADFSRHHGVSVATARKRLNALVSDGIAAKMRIYRQHGEGAPFVYYFRTLEIGAQYRTTQESN